jgi:hypothetical protein
MNGIAIQRPDPVLIFLVRYGSAGAGRTAKITTSSVRRLVTLACKKRLLPPEGMRGRLCCENSKKKTGLRFASRSTPFSGSDSEQPGQEPRLAGRIFLCYPPDSALPNQVDRLNTL